MLQGPAPHDGRLKASDVIISFNGYHLSNLNHEWGRAGIDEWFIFRTYKIKTKLLPQPKTEHCLPVRSLKYVLKRQIKKYSNVHDSL
jgi:hypothetical protein